MSKQPKVFLSYCHADEVWKDLFLTHLVALAQQDDIDIWHDGLIDTGDKWFDKISEALKSADIGICLLTPGFLSSSFITKQEIPALLERQEQDSDFLFFPVLIEPCAWEISYALKPFQVWHKKGKAVSEIRGKPAQNRAFTEIVVELHSKLPDKSEDLNTPRSLSKSLPVAQTNKKNHNLAVDISRMPQSGYELFGRDRELEQLDEAWDRERTNIISLIAWGGVGKSTLVNKWLQFLEQDNYRGAEKVFAWSFYSQGTGDQVTSGDEFIFEALEFFGDRDPSAGSAYERGKRLAELIQKQKSLLLLDGLEPLQAGENLKEIQGRVQDQGIAALLRNLALENPGLCVISSRVKVKDIERYKEKAPVIELEKLSAEAGRALLRIGGVKGDDQQIERVVEEFGGHALAIGLLPGYLKAVDGHKAEQALAIPDLPDVEDNDGKHPRRVVAALLQQLKNKATYTSLLASELLLLLGLFDRPIPIEALRELVKAPAIEGITETLSQQGKAGLSEAIEELRANNLLAKRSEHQKDKIDCHPLIREHFADELKTKRDAWQAAHARLYEYYKDLPEKALPDTLVEMEPLFQAVRHGCLGGMTQEALDDVYWRRIQRNNKYYLVRQIGAIGTDLTCIACFFTKPWLEYDKKLNPDDQALVLNWSGTRLRALGRLGEAQQPLEAGLDLRLKQKDWKNIATAAGNLSELSLILGLIKSAKSYGQQAVECADNSLDRYTMEKSLTTHADALLAQGKFEKAYELFTNAETRQQQSQPAYPFLYSLRGFQFCDYWLSQGEVVSAFERATTTFQWVTNEGWLLDIALDRLSIAKASFARSLLDKVPTQLIESVASMHQSVDGLRKTGAINYLPRGLFARSQFFIDLANADPTEMQKHFKNTWHDLNEIEEIASYGGMKLYLVDYELSVCRTIYGQLALQPDNDSWQIWQNGEPVECNRLEMQNHFFQHLREAEKLIVETGYHRRDAELQNLKDVDITQPDFELQPRPDWLPPFVNKLKGLVDDSEIEL